MANGKDETQLPPLPPEAGHMMLLINKEAKLKCFLADGVRWNPQVFGFDFPELKRSFMIMSWMAMRDQARNQNERPPETPPN